MPTQTEVHTVHDKNTPFAKAGEGRMLGGDTPVPVVTETVPTTKTVPTTQNRQQRPNPSGGTQYNENSNVGGKTNIGNQRMYFGVAPPPPQHPTPPADFSQYANVEVEKDDPSSQQNIRSNVAGITNKGGQEFYFGALPTEAPQAPQAPRDSGDEPSKSKFVRMVQNPICSAVLFAALSLLCLALMIYFRVTQGVNETSFEIATAFFGTFTMAAGGFAIKAIVQAKRRRLREEVP